jgi:hypothetical protein
MKLEPVIEKEEKIYCKMSHTHTQTNTPLILFASLAKVDPSGFLTS